MIILNTKTGPWLWLFCHLNWLRFDQPSLNFRPKQSNIRKRNSPQSCVPFTSFTRDFHWRLRLFSLKRYVLPFCWIWHVQKPRRTYNWTLRQVHSLVHHCRIWAGILRIYKIRVNWCTFSLMKRDLSKRGAESDERWPKQSQRGESQSAWLDVSVQLEWKVTLLWYPSALWQNY